MRSLRLNSVLLALMLLAGCRRGEAAKGGEEGANSLLIAPATRSTAGAPTTTATATTQAAIREKTGLQRISWEFVSVFPRQDLQITISEAGRLSSVFERERKPRLVREAQLTTKQMRRLEELFDRCIHQPCKPDRPTDVRILIRYGSYDFEGYDQRCTELNREVEQLAAAAKVKKR